MFVRECLSVLWLVCCYIKIGYGKLQITMNTVTENIQWASTEAARGTLGNPQARIH